jgi:hypothetical protein
MGDRLSPRYDAKHLIGQAVTDVAGPITADTVLALPSVRTSGLNRHQVNNALRGLCERGVLDRVSVGVYTVKATTGRPNLAAPQVDDDEAVITLLDLLAPDGVPTRAMPAAMRFTRAAADLLAALRGEG